MNGPEQTNTEDSTRLPLLPRQGNHQNSAKPSGNEKDLDGLIKNLTQALEDFKSGAPTAGEIPEAAEKLPRLKQSGTPTLPVHKDGEKLKKRRRRRDKGPLEIPREFEKYVPGSKRREARLRVFWISSAIALLILAISHYGTAKFFYASGLSEGIRRGLEAAAAVENTKSAGTDRGAVLKKEDPPKTQ